MKPAAHFGHCHWVKFTDPRLACLRTVDAPAVAAAVGELSAHARLACPRMVDALAVAGDVGELSADALALRDPPIVPNGPCPRARAKAATNLA